MAGLSLLIGALLIMGAGRGATGSGGSGGAGLAATTGGLQPALSSLIFERLRSGEGALWNPGLGLGLPLSSNPSWGRHDPQIRLLTLFGESEAGAALIALSVLQLSAAVLGAYLLARRLSLRVPGALLAAVGFGASGFLLEAVAEPASRAAFLLPWLLLGLEGLRRARPRSALLGSIAAAYLVGLAADPQVCAFIAVTALLWTASMFEQDRRAARLGLLALLCGWLLAAPSWLPYLESLTLAARTARLGPRELPDVSSLGALLLATFLCSRLSTQGVGQRSRSLATALVVCGLILFLGRRGWGLSPHAVTEWPAAVRLASPVLLFALSGVLQPSATLSIPRPLVHLALGSFLVATSAPGVADLVHLLPGGGAIDTSAAAVLAALFVPLLAGAALERAGAQARTATLFAALFLAGAGLARPTLEEPPRPTPAELSDEVLSYEALPPTAWSSAAAELRGTLHGGLELDRLTLYFDALDESGAALGRTRFLGAAELGAADGEGNRSFTFGDLERDELGPGTWRGRLEFRRGTRLLGTRELGDVVVKGQTSPAGLQVAAFLLTLLFLARWSSTSGRGPGAGLVRSGWVPLLVLALAVGEPRTGALAGGARHLSWPLTEAFLRSRAQGARVVAPEDVLPGASCLELGVAKVNADDGLGLASFERAQLAMVAPDAEPRAAWARGDVDLASEAFKALGVELLLRYEPLEAEGWELVAGPGAARGESVAAAELFVYRARDPVPRAFCASSVTPSFGDVFEQSRRVSSTTALLGAALQVDLSDPAEHASVAPLGTGGDRPSYAVELDGDAVLVLAEQFLPGWEVHVDGVPRQLLRVRGVLRGVYLEAGEHLVELRYRPHGPRWAAWLACAGLVTLIVLLVISGASSLPGRAARR